ncbi:hypothetical protein [Sulfuricaulis limicola]|uniref:hypothetical protein n=1 Tax=Sulfuricaulis limicola TaxID=1620215 RepID=UPI0011E4D16D|nr:hypothetical protein [Sulfuricaulis limicola]
MVSVWRAAELLLLVIAVIAIMVFIALSRESFAASLPVLFIAVSSSVGVYFTDKRIKRLTEPKPIIIPPDFRGPLRIFRGKRSAMLLIAGVVIFLAPVPFMYEDGEHALAIGSGIFGLLSFFALLSYLRNMGMPYLILDDRGITTHVYGHIPWGDVDNALLHVRQSRSSKFYFLGLSVYGPQKYFQRMGFLLRLSRMKWLQLPSERDQLQISLNMLSHEPLYIDAAVKHLRAMYSRRIGVTPKTGDLSIDKNLAEIDKLMDSVKPGDDLANHQAVVSKLEKLTQDVKRELDGQAKKAKKQAVILLIVFLGLIVFVILKIWSELSGH